MPCTTVYALSCVQGLGKAHWSCEDGGGETCTHTLKVHVVTAVVSPAVTYRCKSWTLKKSESQRIDAFKLLSPFDFKETKPVNPKEINPQYSFIGKTDAEVEASILWPPDAKSQLTGKDSDAGKDWK